MYTKQPCTLSMNIPKKRTTNPNLGFLHLSLTGYLLLGLGAALALSLLAVKVQTARLDSALEDKAQVQGEYNAFVTGTRRAGEEQERKSKEKEAANEKQIKDAVTERDVALAKLRQSASSGRRPLSRGPEAPAGSGFVCHESEAYNAAFRRYRERVERSLDRINGLAVEGDEAIIDAETLLRAWPG